VKLAPVVGELAHRPAARVRVCVTAQHREMLDQVLAIFSITPDHDLAVMRPNQGLPGLTARALTGVAEIIEAERPDIVLVQGDTTTAMTAALAAFYARVPVGHVEAGLRSYDRYSPFPEEINRRIVGTMATWHFAPTERAAAALRAERVAEETIYVTGNTVIDALNMTLATTAAPDWPFPAPGRRLVLVTAHRRENFGEPMAQIFVTLRELVERNGDIELVYPVHLNPNVQELAKKILAGQERIHLLRPQDYVSFVHLMARADLILTDSGGVQEEAPTLGKPVLVMRRETERPEAIEAGVARLVGTDPALLLAEAERLLQDPSAYAAMARAANPFGDGTAARQIADILLGPRA
jgi:UDP-N-acetylglucosamine 2-epimerase (non-hydrolysing)